MMVTEQHIAYDRALERAQENGLSVIGRGTWDQGGARFLVIGSASEPGRFHLVTVYPGRLVCDCPSRTLCQHRALAHEELLRERFLAHEQIVRETAAILARVNASLDASERRETVMQASHATNKPFSIW